jgi:signal transduction histidine kinase
MLVSSLSVVLAMIVLGKWVTAEIEKGVIHSTAAAAALFSDSLIEPHVQELKLRSDLSPESQRLLDRLMAPQLAGKSIIAYNIWKGDTIVYGNRSELIGRSFPPTEARARAWTGQVVPAFAKPASTTGIPEELLHLPILEVFAPVRETGTNRIIALAETYEIEVSLRDDLADAWAGSWRAVAAVTLSMIGLQLGIVMSGSRIIGNQRQALSERIALLTGLLAENETLRNRSHDANRRVTELNERFLRQLGSNLHDGPVQLLSMTQLRLGCLRSIMRHVSTAADAQLIREAEEDFRIIEEAVSESLEEIRNVAIGIVPPEIEKLELDDALRMVARRHQRRTGKEVVCDIAELPEGITLALKSCLYRFAQEGLNNAFRHADGVGQVLKAQVADGRIEVSVLDAGPGIVPDHAYDGIGGQGLLLLRDRVTSLGGEFKMENRETHGVRLKASFAVPVEQVTAV